MILEKENDIQTAICEYLSFKHYFFWRQNNSPTMQFSEGKASFRRMGKYTLRGIPDIVIVHNGKVVFLEVKSEKGKLSEYQIEFQNKCIKNNADYYVVRSIDDVQKLGL